MRRNRRPYGFLMFLPVLVLLGLQLVTSYLVTAILSVKGIIDYRATDGDYFEYAMNIVESVSDPKVTSIILTIYACLACLILWRWHKAATGGRINDLSLADLGKKLNFPLFLLAVVLMLIGTSYASEILIDVYGVVRPEWVEFYNTLMEASGFEEINFFMVVSAIFLGPIAEELAFRGLTFGYARSTGMKVQWAIVLQALLFGVTHGNMVQGSYAFILGILMGYTVYKTGNLWSSIIIHIGFNFTGTILSAFMPGGDSLVSFFVITFGSMVCIYLGVLLLNKSLKKADE